MSAKQRQSRNCRDSLSHEEDDSLRVFFFVAFFFEKEEKGYFSPYLTLLYVSFKARHSIEDCVFNGALNVAKFCVNCFSVI